MEKSKVKSVKFKNEWDSKYGKFFNFDLEFESGLVGVYASKTNPQTTFIVGNEIEFTVESSSYGNKIKPIKQDSGGYNKKPYDADAEKFRQFLILAQSSMTKSVDMVIHGLVKIDQLQATCDKLMQQQIDLATKYKSANEN